MTQNKEIDILVLKVLAHDKEAFNKFYEQYYKIVEKHVTKWSYRLNKSTQNLYTEEDVRNEMWEHIIRQLPLYDSSRSAMTTFLYMICDQVGDRINEYYSRKKRTFANSTRFFSYNITIKNEEGITELLTLLQDTTIDIEEDILSEITVIETLYYLKSFIDTLNNRNAIIFYHQIIGLTLRESGEKISVEFDNISHERIRQIRNKIKLNFSYFLNVHKNIDMENAYLYFSTLTDNNFKNDNIAEEFNCSYNSIMICKELINQIFN